MTDFTPWASLAGGALIGLSALLLLRLNGQIAGISGMVKNSLTANVKANGWRWCFLLGLIGGPLLLANSTFTLPSAIPGNGWTVMLGGLLVGLGTVIGSGCTSGHGICGIGRLSRRSIVATVLFMSAAMVTLFVVRHLIGGVL